MRVAATGIDPCRQTSGPRPPRSDSHSLSTLLDSPHRNSATRLLIFQPAGVRRSSSWYLATSVFATFVSFSTPGTT